MILVSITYLVFFFLFASGLINAILEGTNLPKGLNVIQSRSVQTFSETIIITFILFVGLFGTFLLYRSGQSINAKTQYGFLVGGFFILTLSLILGLMLIKTKIGF